MSVNVEIREERISRKQEGGRMTCSVIVSNILLDLIYTVQSKKGVGLK